MPDQRDMPPVLSALDARTLLDGLGDAVVVADDGNRIVYVNTAAERLLGWPAGDLVGAPLTTIVPERYQDAHLGAFARYLRTHEPRLVGGPPTRVPAVRCDGSEIEIELTLASHAVGDRELFVASLRDLSDRVRLEREQEMSRYLATSREITARLALSGRAGSLADAAPVVLEAVGTTLGWQVGGVWEVVGDELRPIARWSAPGYADAADELTAAVVRLPSGVGLPGRVAAAGQPAWIDEIADDENFARAGICAAYGLRSAFAFPVVVDGLVHGAVELFSRDPRPPESRLMAAMSVVGAELGQFIERERGREHLVGLARALQASLLPPGLPTVPGLELAAAYHAAAGEGHVGGDFYDVFPLGSGRWGVAMGDVCGRGPRAAALTALARYTIRAAAPGAGDPGDVLRALHSAVHADLAARDDEESFLTAVYVDVTPADGGMRVRVANGGHPPPLVLGPRGARPACDGGTLLGLLPTVSPATADLVLAAGEMLLLVTDGVLEARAPTGEQFGDDRLAATALGAAPAGASAVVAAVEAAVATHAAERGRADDLAILVLRATG